MKTEHHPEFKLNQQLICTDNALLNLTEGKIYEVVEIGAYVLIVDDNGNHTPAYYFNGNGEGGVWWDGFDKNSIINEPVNDPVEFPSHYMLPGGGETIDLIRRELTDEEFQGFCKGNILKYLCRASSKNGAEDWSKARKYFEFMEEK